MDERENEYAVYDAASNLWFLAMDDESSSIPVGCGVWTSIPEQAKRMSRADAKELCRELKAKANDGSWPIGVRLAPCALGRLRELWDEFGGVPINDDDQILIQFMGFGPGTDRFEIWRWFDDQCPNGLFEDILGVKPMYRQEG